jgi:hypothetical protein
MQKGIPIAIVRQKKLQDTKTVKQYVQYVLKFMPGDDS